MGVFTKKGRGKSVNLLAECKSVNLLAECKSVNTFVNSKSITSFARFYLIKKPLHLCRGFFI